MAGVNKVILVGNLGIDPEIRSLENGVKVARLRVATTETYRDRQGDRREITEWHTVTLWRGLAEVAEKYLAKGKQIYVEGKLKTRQWTDNEGRERYSTEVVADQMQMLGRVSDYRDDNQPGGSQVHSQEPQRPSPQESDQKAETDHAETGSGDDLPF